MSAAATEPRERSAALDRIARLAAVAFDAPIGTIAIVRGDSFAFEGLQGLDCLRARPIEGTICKHVLRTGRPLIVADVRASEYAREPICAELGIGFYAGAPLVQDGVTIGLVAIAGPEARETRPSDGELLADLAALALTELDLASRGTALGLLAAVGGELDASLDLEETLAAILRNAVPALGDACVIDLVVEGGRTRSVSKHGDASKEALLHELRARYPFSLEGATAGASALRRGEPILIPEITSDFLAAASQDSTHRTLLDAIASRSGIAVPLVARARVLGVLSLGSVARLYSELDLATARAFASRAALAIDNARLIHEAQVARRAAESAASRFERLQAITATFSEAITPERVCAVATAHGTATLGAQACVIALIAEDGVTLETVAASGVPDDLVARWRRFPLTASIPIAEAARTGRPSFLATRESGADQWPALADPGYDAFAEKAIASLPLAANGKRLGALGVVYSGPRAFTLEDEKLLGALACQLALALERARLSEAVAAEERTRLVREQAARAAAETTQARLAFLAEASRTLAASLERDETVDRIVRLPLPLLGECALLDLVEDDGRIRRAAVVHSEPARAHIVERLRAHDPVRDAPDGVLRSLHEGVAQTIAPIPEGFLWTHAGSEDERDALRELDLASLIRAPLVARGRTVGVLTIGSALRRHDEEDRILAEDLASRAAIALDNARLYREVLRADHAKTDFLSMLAHELRNPLAPVATAAHLLKTGKPQVIERARAVLERQVRHMTRIVDDLLDVSRITRGKVELRRERVDLATIARETIDDYRPAAEAASIALEVAMPAGPVIVNGDATRLAQVLANVVSNALKFTDAGGEVSLSVFEEGAAAVARIADTGIGLTPEVRERVFEAFVQGESTLARSRGGLGLGLAVVKGLVELHGGTVRAESPGAGRGTTFTVRLPLDRAEVAAQAVAPSPATPDSAEEAPGQRGSSPLRVLIIEDNRDAADTLQTLLELHGHSVETAYDGDDGLARARRQRPDVVLCDIGLPSKDGYQVARELRADPATRSARLVALTGYGLDEDRRRSRSAGFDLHLTKPLGTPDLARALFVKSAAPGPAAGPLRP